MFKKGCFWYAMITFFTHRHCWPNICFFERFIESSKHRTLVVLCDEGVVFDAARIKARADVDISGKMFARKINGYGWKLRIS